MQRRSHPTPDLPSKHLNTNRLGFIGLGLLGIELARRVHAAGFEVVGYDLNDAAAQRIKPLGRRVYSAGEVAQSCSHLVLTLPDADVSKQVVEELKPALRRGTFILDVTTGDPEEMGRLGRQLARRGVRYLDTTILGSSADVAQGHGLLMAGGGRRDFADCHPLLSVLSERVFHLGPCGSGARMKLVVNLVLGLNRAALAEGLAFADAMGVDPAQALEVLQSGLAYSRIMDAKGPKMLKRDFHPVARLSQHLKDVRLMLQAAATCDQALPLTTQHEALLAAVVASGGGDLDNSAVFLAYSSVPRRPES